MELSAAVKNSIDRSVLCWLATASADNVPNVSPKEIFNCFGANEVIVANIASPQTVKNIGENNQVCISFIDIVVQKGFQLKGQAEVIDKTTPGFKEREWVLLAMTGGKFPFATITKISVEQVKPIIAPRYLLYPETTEADQVASALVTYGMKGEYKSNE